MQAFRLIQITDSHLMVDTNAVFRTQNVFSNLQKVIDDAQQHQASALLLTGDLAEQTKVETYQHYVSLLKNWSSPIYFTPGNHDDAELMHGVLKNHFCADKTFTLGHWQIVLLNSKVTYDSGEGEINQHQLDFLQRTITQHTEKYFMVVLHHHVLPTKGHMDNYIVKNGERFLQTLTQYKNIKLVLSGHIHQEFDDVHEDIRFLGTPATSYQTQPKQTKFIADDKSPGYRIIDLFDDGSFTTEIKRI